MTMAKKKKRVLLIGILAAVVVIAAVVVVAAAVFTSSPAGPRFQQSVYTEGDLQYIIVNGVLEEETTPPLVNYGFTPPEGWTLVEDSTQTANRFSTHYQDVYQNQAGESLTFSQGYAIDSQLIYIQGEFQEVQFGDFTILFSCGEEEQLDGTKPKSEATWIYQNSLLTVTCQQELDVNQMLDLVNRVQYDTLREPEYTSLSFWHGQTVTDENGVTYLNEDYYEYVVEGNPDVPAVPDWFYFTRTPEGYELESFWQGERDIFVSYVNAQGEQILLTCETQTGLQTLDLDFQELSDPTAVEETTFDGKACLIHINENVSEMVWLEDYCYISISSTSPLTRQELLDLASTVSREAAPPQTQSEASASS